MSLQLELEIFGMEAEEQEAKLELDALTSYLRKSSIQSPVGSPLTPANPEPEPEPEITPLTLDKPKIKPALGQAVKRTPAEKIKPVLSLDAIKKAMMASR